MGFQAYHNSYEKYYREPFGAVPCGQTVIMAMANEAGAIESGAGGLVAYSFRNVGALEEHCP